MMRSLNPMSVRVSPHGELILSFFGLTTSAIGSAKAPDYDDRCDPNYLSPELLMAGRAVSASYKDDVWAAGCVVYYAASGQHLFDGENYEQILNAIRCEVRVPTPTELDIQQTPLEPLNNFERLESHMTGDMAQFVRAVLEPVRSLRLTAEQVLAHPALGVTVPVPRKERQPALTRHWENDQPCVEEEIFNLSLPPYGLLKARVRAAEVAMGDAVRTPYKNDGTLQLALVYFRRVTTELYVNGKTTLDTSADALKILGIACLSIAIRVRHGRYGGCHNHIGEIASPKHFLRVQQFVLATLEWCLGSLVPYDLIFNHFCRDSSELAWQAHSVADSAMKSLSSMMYQTTLISVCSIVLARMVSAQTTTHMAFSGNVTTRHAEGSEYCVLSRVFRRCLLFVFKCAQESESSSRFMCSKPLDPRDADSDELVRLSEAMAAIRTMRTTPLVEPSIEHWIAGKRVGGKRMSVFDEPAAKRTTPSAFSTLSTPGLVRNEALARDMSALADGVLNLVFEFVAGHVVPHWADVNDE